jgi:hypothetical protein
MFRGQGQEKPVFSINPPIVMTMNDTMARDLVEVLERVIEAGERLPPSVFSFKQALKADLERP